ncbi:MAG TPA: aminotransferase class V-fold PLP-dependent enzyme [Spirochaetia bacterium]|nr:aminotransferase class V-fold PLP-dependent enzyme [Spirochaetia bacterium]
MARIHDTMRKELRDKGAFCLAQTSAFEYIDAVPERSVFPPPDAVEGLSVFDEALPSSPSSGEEVIRLLAGYGSPATVAQTGGRYFGFVNGGAVPAALAARWLADVWDQNPALYVISPVAAKLEQICEEWLVDLLGLPNGTVAGLVGGTSIAILCGLAAARYSILKSLGWDVNARGLAGAPPFRVVVSEQAHSSVFKALALLGIGREQLEKVRADPQGRIDPSCLPGLDSSTLLILQAGNVNTGAFDDFLEICSVAQSAGAWVHIDGAFGLLAQASRKTAHLTAGIELADSWSVDGHKALNTPYDCGIVLCRDRDSLVGAMQASGAYIQYSENRDGMLYGPDMSRRARSVELWATLKFLGREGIEEMIDELCERAVQFGERLQEEGFRVLNEVVFNQVLVSCSSPEETTATLRALQGSGVCWCGGSTWLDEPAIRISVCSWATTAEDVERSVDAFVAARKGQSR